MTRVKAGQRQRARAPKVRTGCKTCKVRRVKCDELHPACKRCTSTGRICDGYEPSASASASSSSSLAALSPSPRAVTILTDHSPEEWRSLQFFRDITLKQLSTFFQDSFWNSEVLQIAHGDANIWHSLVAFSSFHEQFITPIEDPDRNRFALSQYNKSLKGISTLQSTRSSAQAHVVSCILFICIEILRGNLGASIELVKVGYRVLKENKHLIDGDGDSTYKSLFTEVHDFFTRMIVQVYMLTRNMDSQVCEIVDCLINDNNESKSWQAVFTSLTQAQSALSHVRLEFERFDPPDAEAIYSKLVSWASGFETFLNDYGDTLQTPSEKRAIALLQLQSRYFLIDVGVHVQDNNPGHDPNPLMWDDYCDEFNAMLDTVEHIMRLDELDMSSRQAQFHMHTGIVPVLHGLIRKCRDPAIRRRALSIMCVYPLREGFWDASLIAATARRILVKEEGLSSPASCQDIPLVARVRNLALAAINTPSGGEQTFMVGFEFVNGWWWERADAPVAHSAALSSCL